MDTHTRTPADAVEALSPKAPAAARTRGAIATRAGVAIGLASALVAYRDLLWYAPEKSLSEEVEQLFFMPSQGVAPLVLLLSVWLLHRRSGRLRALPPASAPWLGAALLGAGACIHVWATLTGAPDLLVPSLGLVGFAVAALWKGRAAVRAVLLPVLFLIFAMPLPAPLLNEVIFRLQIGTTELTGALLTLLRVPHYVAGEQILRTSQTFSVIETCSGLRSIETLTMVAILMADLFGRTRLHALALVLAAPPLAFFLNGWRAVALILNPHSELVAVHNLQGIAILLSGLVVLYLFDGALEKLAPSLGAARGRAPVAPALAASSGPPGPRRAQVTAASAVLGGLALVSVALPRFDTAPPDAFQLSARLASGVGDLFSQEVPTDRVFLGSAGFLDSVTRRFQRGGRPVDVFVGIGWRPGRARSPISPKTAVPGSGWIAAADETRVLEPDGREVRRILYRSDTQTLVAYHWYEGSGGLALEALRAWAALDASPLRRSGEIIAVRMTTDVVGPVATGLAPAEARLDAFYVELRRTLDRMELSPPIARGKPFLHFPARANFFHPDGSDGSLKIFVDQELGVRSGLGMALARCPSEVAAVRGDPSRDSGVRPPPEPGASGSMKHARVGFGLISSTGKGYEEG